MNFTMATIGSVLGSHIAGIDSRLQSQLNTLSSGGGNGLVYHEVTENTTCSSFNAYVVATNVGAITLTLPASPTVGHYLKIIDGDGNASTNNITVSGNGKHILWYPNDMLITIDRSNLVLVYISESQGWVLG